MDSGLLKRLSGNATVIGFAVSTLAGVVFGGLGPFGSYLNGGLMERVGYWLVSLWGCWALFGLGVPWIARQAYKRRLPLWVWWPPSIIGLALPAALYSRFVATLFWPAITSVGFLEWYGQSVAISAIATTGVMLLTRQRDEPKSASEAASGSDSADPRDRLAPALGRTVICLQMEDHYVRVHTLRGSALVLMSLSQAMDGLKDVEGQKVHRSWWVARSAIEGVVEDGRNIRLKLSQGLQAPVSRAHVGRLREQGWL